MNRAREIEANLPAVETPGRKALPTHAVYRQRPGVVEERRGYGGPRVVSGRVRAVPQDAPESGRLKIDVKRVVRSVGGPRELHCEAACHDEPPGRVFPEDVNVGRVGGGSRGHVEGVDLGASADVHDVIGSRREQDGIHRARVDHPADHIGDIRQLPRGQTRLAVARLEGDRSDVCQLDDGGRFVLRDTIRERSDARTSASQRKVERSPDRPQRVLFRRPSGDTHESRARLCAGPAGPVHRPLDDDDRARRRGVCIAGPGGHGDRSGASREGRRRQKGNTVAEPHGDILTVVVRLSRGKKGRLTFARATIGAPTVPIQHVHVQVLILAAFSPELALLRAELGDTMTGVIAGLSVAARVVGVGLPLAAAGAAAHVAEIQPDAVVLVGTCGAYLGASLRIGEVIVARRIHLVDPGSLEGHAQFPEPVCVVLDAHVGMTDALSAGTARPCSVATTLAITINDAVAARIAEGIGAQVEHLEAHGVAIACASRGVAFAAALGIANFVGARGREEWRGHHGVAEAAAVRSVLRWLEAGAPGVMLRR
jgi:futalosine hydrolase